MIRAARAREEGFTLVEVMVALLIFSMLAVAGVAILSFSVRAGAVSAARLDQAAALQRTVAVLSADLAQAVDRPWRDEGGMTRPAFTGDGAGMTLVRGGWSNLDGAPRPSLQRVAYVLNGGALQRTAYPFLDGAAPLPAAVLMTDLKSLRFRFRHDGAWSDVWQGGPDQPLPDAAELLVVRRDGVTYRALLAVGTGYRPAGVSTRVS
ncbi:type II secretion system protein J (GspJ) [Sphingomonas gellani]|uniref:Type II secretion system protein J n=1 Tax=Sphingomonas gellani TaxID=1166340 RepID=A0A1H7Y9A5_9SPHN|nr:type II secretion system minor pseudopilin GspJ [Sphingomonas gellani]SEM42491.1 type II secretion system protein J (GspJ) [Sphingomonas gellani]